MFTDLIMNYVKDQALEQISNKIGIDPALLKGTGGNDAIGSLLGGLFKNTQDEKGLEQLDKAVEKDHDGSIFDDIGSLLGKGEGEGNKIVEHILGDKQGVVAQLLAKKLGISVDQAGMVLSYIAPMVMGALGKAKKETGADATALKKMIDDEEKVLAQESKTPSIVEMLLDKDGDGDVDINDLLKLAV